MNHEIENLLQDGWFVAQVIAHGSYICALMTRIALVPQNSKSEVVTRNTIYDEMCRLLTDYENGVSTIDATDFYSMLCKIQNNWEDVITAQD